MKVARLVQKFPLVLLFASPLLCAADLASYRGFQFGMSLSAAAKHSGMDFIGSYRDPPTGRHDSRVELAAVAILIP